MTVLTSHQTGEPPFGRLLTAMVTPFDSDGELDLPTARALAAHLVDDLGHDGLVVNGTTGEAPTTTDAEKAALVTAVVDEVGDRARIVAGVGTNDTRHTVELARQAADAGAHGLLVVAPYYSKPPQSGLLVHFRTVADATDLPVVIYDIPKRAGIPVETDTLLALARHPRIVAVKDAKGNIVESARVIRDSGLAYYSGDDAYTLPLLAVGGTGVVGTSTHFTGGLVRRLLDAWFAGDEQEALAIHRRALDVFTGVFAAQGCSMVKAGLALQGLPVGGLRPPQMLPEQSQIDTFAATLRAAGLL